MPTDLTSSRRGSADDGGLERVRERELRGRLVDDGEQVAGALELATELVRALQRAQGLAGPGDERRNRGERGLWRHGRRPEHELEHADRRLADQEGCDRRVVEVVEVGGSRLEHCLGERPDGALVRYAGTGENVEPLDRTPPDHASGRTGCVGREPRDPLGAPQLVAARRQGLRGQHQCRAGQSCGSVGVRAQDKGRLARGNSRRVPLGCAERAARAVELEQCADLALEPDRDEEGGSRAGPLRDPPEAR